MGVEDTLAIRGMIELATSSSRVKYGRGKVISLLTPLGVAGAARAGLRHSGGGFRRLGCLSLCPI